MRDRWTRRGFLTRLGQAGVVAAGAPLLRCGGSDGGPSDPILDALTDTLGPTPDAADTAGPRGPAEALTLSKGPWLHVVGADRVRFRFETREDVPLEVELRLPNGHAVIHEATVEARHLDYTFPPEFLWENMDHPPDEPGLHAVQEVFFGDLLGGERYHWTLHLGGGEQISGSFLAPAPLGAALRVGWIADTMWPNAEPGAAILARRGIDLALHGGDIQYQPNPFDTWNGMFAAMAGVLRQAPMHFCVGNHEYEGQDEYNVQFVRLFEGHGEAGTVDYHAFTNAGVRFLMLNSEVAFADPASPQIAWLEAQLEAARQDPLVRHPVVCFHRPYFTFGRAGTRAAARELLHPIMTRFEVPLVLTGHNHAYERFEVEGVTYIVDGGGGAGLYDVDTALVEGTVPAGEIGWQKVASKSHGVCLLTVTEDGGLHLEREEHDGTITDEVTVA